jgi:hypothetical protein
MKGLKVLLVLSICVASVECRDPGERESIKGG